MRILLVDDQQEVRSALRLLLEQEDQVRIVGEAEDVDDIFSCVQDTHPNLLLLDWELPGFQRSPRGTAAMATVRALQALYPDLKIIALSGRPEARPEALAARADSFVSKGDPPEVLLETLHTLHRKN